MNTLSGYTFRCGDCVRAGREPRDHPGMLVLVSWQGKDYCAEHFAAQRNLVGVSFNQAIGCNHD